MAKPEITEALLASGQNEGIERSILPLPQLSAVQNARQRKTGRWGKRYGTTTLSAFDSSGNLLGNGTGNRRDVGPGFCVVDDRCYAYDQNAAQWVDPKKTVTANGTASVVTWVPGAISGWKPKASFFPVPTATIQNQVLTYSAQAYFVGYLWSAVCYQKTNSASDFVVRIVATSPTDNTLAYTYDVYPSGTTAGDGGALYPRLIVCGGTLVVTYAARLNNAARGIRARKLTNLAGGFGAETVLDTNTSNGMYDAFAQDATNFATVAVNGTTNVSVHLITASTLASAASKTYTSPVNVVGCSVVTGAGQPIYLLLSTTAAGNSTIDLEVYNTTLTTLVSGIGNTVDNIAAAITPPTAYGTLLAGGAGIRFVYGDGSFPAATTLDKCIYRDANSTGVGIGGTTVTLYRSRPVSRPFNIIVGGVNRVYCWVTNSDVSGYGYATLVRLADTPDFGNVGASTQASVPVELSAQDYPVEVSLLLKGPGLPQPVQIGTSAAWSVLLPIYTSLPDTGYSTGMNFRALVATHYTDSASQLSTTVFPADGAQLVPGGGLARVGTQDVTQVGYPLNPRLFGAVPAAGGALIASTTYLYAAVYTNVNSLGRAELSGVSSVLAVPLGAGQTQVTLSIANLTIGERAGAKVELYRTLSNGSVFYRVAILDAFASPAVTLSGFQNYTDTLADSVIATNRVLYTQVGQTLPNAPPPPCRFGIVGGQRVWLGGLLRGDVAQCSKLMLGDQSPTFCDNDAFRVVVPGTLTGLAFMDNLMLFTDEGDGGVYVVSGDGPDDSGDGQFSPAQRLPYAVGCIEPRSVIAVDEGCFFQSRRGLYMIPRGFGAPVPAGDVVMDTLVAFPIITGVAVVTKPGENTIRWTCVDAATPIAGRCIVYDLAHKCWSVDIYGAGNALPHIAQGQWFGGEVAMAGPSVGASTQKVTGSTFDDEGSVVTMRLVTGDLRPFGSMGEGVMSKVNALAEVRSACTLQTTKTTEFGASTAQRTFALAAGDYQVGQVSVTEIELGNAELRDAMSLRVQLLETSTSEGLAFVALAIEHQGSEGLKRVSPLSRTT